MDYELCTAKDYALCTMNYALISHSLIINPE